MKKLLKVTNEPVLIVIDDLILRFCVDFCSAWKRMFLMTFVTLYEC